MSGAVEILKRRIVEIGLKILRDNLTYGTSGNISCIIREENKMLITPSGMHYEEIKPEDVSVVDIDGNIIEGKRKPSIETQLHLSIYRYREDVGSIIHTHSPYAVAVSSSILDKVPMFLDELFSHIGGEIRIARYAPPGSRDLAENAVRSLGERNAVLLSNHGAVSCGRDLDEALETAITVERICKIFVLTSSLGDIKILPPEGVEYQIKSFKNRMENK